MKQALTDKPGNLSGFLLSQFGDIKPLCIINDAGAIIYSNKLFDLLLKENGIKTNINKSNVSVGDLQLVKPRKKIKLKEIKLKKRSKFHLMQKANYQNSIHAK